MTDALSCNFEKINQARVSPARTNIPGGELLSCRVLPSIDLLKSQYAENRKRQAGHWAVIYDRFRGTVSLIAVDLRNCFAAMISADQPPPLINGCVQPFKRGELQLHNFRGNKNDFFGRSSVRRPTRKKGPRYASWNKPLFMKALVRVCHSLLSLLQMLVSSGRTDQHALSKRYLRPPNRNL